MNSLRARYDNRMKQQQEEFNEREEKMGKMIEALKAKNKKLRDESNEDEAVKKKAVRRYEKEMSYNLNEHQEGFKKEQKQLMELREHFSKVDAEKECIANEEGLADARRAKLEYEKSRRNEAP